MKVNIRVIEAKDIQKVNFLGKSDPFIYGSLARAANFKTSVKKDTLNPKWDEIFQLPIEKGADTIHILLKDKATLSDNLLAKLELPIASFQVGKVYDSWYNMRPIISGKKGGQIHLVIQVADAKAIPFVEITGPAPGYAPPPGYNTPPPGYLVPPQGYGAQPPGYAPPGYQPAPGYQAPPGYGPAPGYPPQGAYPYPGAPPQQYPPQGGYPGNYPPPPPGGAPMPAPVPGMTPMMPATAPQPAQPQSMPPPPSPPSSQQPNPAAQPPAYPNVAPMYPQVDSIPPPSSNPYESV